MKKILSALLALTMILSLALSFVSCSGSKTITKENIKIGLITLHDDSSTYDKNFIDSMKKALNNLSAARPSPGPASAAQKWNWGKPLAFQERFPPVLF